MKKRLTRRVVLMLRVSLRRFPELDGRAITVGHTRTNLGSAVLPRGARANTKLTIRLAVRNLTYNTIGHELTHLVQGLSRHHRAKVSGQVGAKIPVGEKQCDIWTLARSALFCDDAPTYLRLPRAVREEWPRYAAPVRTLCIAAIEKRKHQRFYIRWLESEIKRLARKPSASQDDRQMRLPFDG